MLKDIRSFVIILLFFLLALSCTDRKGTNPLTEGNEAPVLQVLGFESDTLVYITENAYEFEFMATDEVGQKLKASAKSIGAKGMVTISDQTESGLYTATYTPTQKGEHVIEITVSDGLSSTTDMLTVFFGDNKNPVAVIGVQEVSRDISNLRFTYEFTDGASQDRDSDILTSIWNLDGVEIEQTFGTTFRHTFDYYADYDIELSVVDEYGGVGVTSQTIDNSRPLASFQIQPNSQAQNGDQRTFNATSSISPRGAISTYRWYSRSTDGVAIIAEATGNTLSYTVNLPVGSNEIGLVVIDAQGDVSDTTWVAFTVVNSPPTANFAFNTGLEQIIITENTSADEDPGDVLSYSWFINDTLQSAQDNEALPTFNIRGATYQLRLLVTDQHGGSNARTLSASVPGRPEAHFVFPDNVLDNYLAHNGTTVTINGGTSIAGNLSTGIQSYTWTLRRPSKPDTVLSNALQSSITMLLNHEIGEYEVGLKITNREGLESTVWKSMTIANSSPIAEFTCSFTAHPQMIVYHIVTNDSRDVDPGETLTYRWYLDGVLQTAQTGRLPSFSRSLNAFVNSIRLEVQDSHGAVGTTTVTGGCQ